MTYKDKGSYESSPPCIQMCPLMYLEHTVVQMGHICITYTLKNNTSIHIKQPIYTYLCVKEVYQGTRLYNIHP